MFTSRAEYRLLLREDNADIRLREIGHHVGLISENEYGKFLCKMEMIAAEIERICSIKLTTEQMESEILANNGFTEIDNGTTFEQFLKRPQVTYDLLSELDPVSRETPSEVKKQVEIQIKYRGYIERQLDQVERARKLESTQLPVNIDYTSIKGLTTEVREKLAKTRPDTLGQASRIPGVTPAAISVLTIALKAQYQAK